MIPFYRTAAAGLAAAFLSLSGAADILRWQVTGEVGASRLAWASAQTPAERGLATVCPAWSALGRPGSLDYLMRRELLDVAGSVRTPIRDVLATGCVTYDAFPRWGYDENSL